MNDLFGRRAIVSGAARGIGLAIASRLVEGGARVALTDWFCARRADRRTVSGPGVIDAGELQPNASMT